MKQIEDIAQQIELAYKFGTYKEINSLFDRSQSYPVVAELLPLKGAFGLKYDSVKDLQEITLLFLDIDQIPVDSSKTAKIVERMKSAALDFIAELNQTGEFEPVDETTLQYYTIVKQFDKCLTGIEITLNLKPTKAVCL